MAKGKRTYYGFISTESNTFMGITTLQKKNFQGKELPRLKKYDKKLRKHVVIKLKEVK
jgi:ribosomal protein L33